MTKVKKPANSPENQPTESVESQKSPENISAPTFEDLKNLMETSSLLQKMYAKLDLSLEKHQVFAQIEELIKDAFKNADEQEKEELSDFREKLENFSETRREKRQVNFVESVDKLKSGEKLNEQEKNSLAAVLERQNFGKVFNELKNGDRVLSWGVPGADFLSIKKLNDDIVGPTITNLIIEEKRKVVEQEMKKLQEEVQFIQNDYKVEVVRLPEGFEITTAQLEAVAKAVDVKMTSFIVDLIKKLPKEEKKKKAKVLKNFNDALLGISPENKGKSGFRMNYGLSVVNGDEPKDKLLALTMSLQTSRMARENKDGTYGSEYKEEKIIGELDEVKSLRDGIIGGKNIITDKDGNDFTLFKNIEGKWVLNKDVVRDVRKGKFKAQNDETNKKMLELVSVYLKKLNIIDVIKPFISDEDGIKKAATNAEAKKNLADQIRTGELSAEYREAVVKALRAEEKDARFTSKSEFNKRATAMNNVAYVSLDVLDLGVDQLLDYESILQEVDNLEGEEKLKKFNELALEAGNKMTKKLEEFRDVVAEVCGKFGLNKDLIAAEVGGDELTLAINTEEVTEEQLLEIMYELKQKTNTRVTKTVVAKAEKNISPDSSEKSRVEEHLKAIKRAEAGAGIAKDVEEAVRKLNLILQTQGEEAVAKKVGSLSKLFVIEAIKEKQEVKASVIVLEEEGEFKIAKLGYKFDYKAIQKDLDKLLGK